MAANVGSMWSRIFLEFLRDYEAPSTMRSLHRYHASRSRVRIFVRLSSWVVSDKPATFYAGGIAAVTFSEVPAGVDAATSEAVNTIYLASDISLRESMRMGNQF